MNTLGYPPNPHLQPGWAGVSHESGQPRQRELAPVAVSSPLGASWPGQPASGGEELRGPGRGEPGRARSAASGPRRRRWKLELQIGQAAAAAVRMCRRSRSFTL